MGVLQHVRAGKVQSYHISRLIELWMKQRQL